LVTHAEEVELKADSDGIHFFTQKGKKVDTELWAAAGVSLGRCQVVLTNLRLVAIVPTTSGGRMGWGINLANVAEVEDCATNVLRRSTRIRVHVKKTLPGSKSMLNIDIGIGFEREGILGDIGLKEDRKDVFLELIRRALVRKSWEAIEEANREMMRAQEMVASSGTHTSPALASVANTNREHLATGAGVGGLQNRQQKALSAAEKLTEDATGDLDCLMQRAREVVKTVEKFAKLAENNTNSAGAEGNDSSDGDGDDTSSVGSLSTTTTATNDMDSILMSIGMVSPVTKFSAGRMYHKQLARQIADLLASQGRLHRMGGMISLTDLYCILNRARGTELVSPDDVYKAARLMARLRVGMHLVKFASGVNMIQSDDLKEEKIFQRLMELWSGGHDGDGDDDKGEREGSVRRAVVGMLYSDVASQLGISIVVAKEQVLLAEQRGLLCRDDSVYGVAFYANSVFAW
jgi:ESCRT-II complex subunit VPS36